MGDRTMLNWICCSCCGGDEAEEKTPIISETLLYFAQEAQRRRSEQTNLWSEPHDTSHTERDDDRELYNLLQKRSRTRRGSQGYRRLSLDIEAVRQERRDVLGKWKVILQSLGFAAEADSLLTVTSTTTYSSLRSAPHAKHLLDTLAQETNIFDSKMPAERYIYVLDRLITLDAAQDFVAKARSYFPRDPGPEPETEPPADAAAVLVKKSEMSLVTDEELEELDEEAVLSRSLEL
ncbi:melanoregulin [Pristis pectinata]|uniref:melanoregulin n=1 Tax=Pristis pectinata TaxID=685728 RepID=UPI00223CBB25|nr:melanoregulin [Pristis pectinata]